MTSTPPATPAISKMAHKCWFCARVFPSAMTRQRHVNAVHGARETLIDAAVDNAPAVGNARNEDIVPPAPDTSTDAGDADDGGSDSTIPDGTEVSEGDRLIPEPPAPDADGVHRWGGPSRETADSASAFVNECAVSYLTRQANQGVARGSLAGPRPLAGAVRHVFATSVAARIRGYYEAMPEASMSAPVVPRELAGQPSRFSGPLLSEVLKFSLVAGGCGLSRVDRKALASLLLLLEGGMSEGGGSFTSSFPTPSLFVSGMRKEEDRVLANLGWQVVPIEIVGTTFCFYYRDLLDVAVGEIKSATHLNMDGAMLPHADDGSRRRSSTMDSDLFLRESADVRRLHGAGARPLLVKLHADEALVSWSGAHYVFPIRAEFPNVLDGGSRWVTIGYIPRISKSVQHTAKARLAVSDARNDLLQRCLAVVLRRFSRASEVGYPVDIPGKGMYLLVPRISGIVVDMMEERSIYALMGPACKYICTHCRVHREVCGLVDTEDAPERNVVETLEAQLPAAERRVRDPRPSLRAPLGRAHSALAFVPALGAVHGLSTGGMNYFRIVSFDLLHVWKLGMLRTLAQRVPAFLRQVCTLEAGARLAPVQCTLDALNERGFELGRRRTVSASSPGCFVPQAEAQSTMTGKVWRHFAAYWPHMVAGLLAPADPDRLAVPAPAPIAVAEGLDEAAGGSDDGRASEESNDDEAEQAEPTGFSTGEGSAYHTVFGNMGIEDAVQTMFCRAADLNGKFFGDNMKETVITTGSQVDAVVATAQQLGREIQVILGPLHTSKMHRMLRHLKLELEERGNLWEGDTSQNEALHKGCKRMYGRSNKRGHTLALQMMRGEQAQAEVLRGIVDAESDGEQVPADDNVDVSALRRSCRGWRVSVRHLSAGVGMGDLAGVLGVDEDTTVTVARAVPIHAVFEWGGKDVVQVVRGTSSFNGAPWYDHVRYVGTDGAVRWGQVRAVLRAVHSETRHCVAVWRMRKVPARDGCVLTKYGCQRLAWELAGLESHWPVLEVVDISRVLRLEEVLPDWRDLADRHGVRAMPSTKPATREECHRSRFFTNVFHPWTSRRLAPRL